jgi:hypothetical protein
MCDKEWAGRGRIEKEKNMNATNATKSRGTIIKVPDATPGILVVNGQQRPFTLERVWKSPVAPAANQNVDVELDAAGALASITVVDQQALAKEKLTELSGVAQERGKEAAKLAQQGIGALAARMGTVPLAAAVLFVVAWFLFSAAGISGGPMPVVSYTFWNLLGTDFSNDYSLMSPGHNHGLLAVLGLAAIAAPFAAPFIRAAWSKYLNAVPLAFLIIGSVAVYLNAHKAFGELVKAGVPNPFSWRWGIFVLALAGLVLAAQALKPPAHT